MKKIVYALVILTLLWSCKSGQMANNQKAIEVLINLNDTKNDKVAVTVLVPPSMENNVFFNIPKTVPGTYSIDNYGKYIESLKAYDSLGNEIQIIKIDDSTWKIFEAKKLYKVTYLVNDTYDIESQHKVFSPAGTNISPNNYMLNLHGFVGFFSHTNETPYTVTITHSETLFGSTSMTDTNKSNRVDVYKMSRYAELIDHPIMYTKPDYTTFTVDGMEILISVYSPNGNYKATDISTEMEKMMRAQKKFLGKINSTKKYAVLLYLSDLKKPDAKGFGALEHPTSTTVVMPEMMPKEQMVEALIDVVSHEFFHIVTPLTVHSNEIHYFDFNAPKMSKHLWMYEGITEYFANLFQVNQGLITEEDFYKRLSSKIINASAMNDKMPFTKMSENVLIEPYKSQYLNVYEKGALIGMCIDIIIREKSNGKKGVLDLMQKLSNKFGAKKPFNDDELFDIVTAMTYPEVKFFLETYVSGSNSIPYDDYFAKVGVSRIASSKTGNVFLKGQKPYIDVDQSTKEIKVIPNEELPEFYSSLGIQNGDVITSVNNKKYNLDNIYELLSESQNWKQNDKITLKIKRDNKVTELKGKVVLPKELSDTFEVTDQSKKNLKESWLKG
ncbi:peptidase M61 [Flavobacterium sp.]|uniref:M61 family metallopeptidase n=1 Tax=Flavobacterium sp. TaxID=239 RepID=UPI00286E0929|nr:peptidase M61 [Flavobacterium sp.]